MSANADIVVVGGGPGGFAAALKARRMGASVILIEKYDIPGGIHTSGLQGAADAGAGGIHSELMARFSDHGLIYTATEKTHPDWAGNPLSHYERNLKAGAKFTRSSFDPQGAGAVMADMLADAGVETMFGTSFTGVVLGGDGDTIAAVIVENAAATRAVTAKIFVEGTGTAELVARSGAPFQRGGGGQPPSADWDGRDRPIPGGLLWTMRGIDFAKVAAYQKTANDPTLAKLIAQALSAGDIPADLYRPRMAGSGVYGDYYIGHPTVDMSPIQDGTYILWQNVPYEWALHIDDDARDAARAESALASLVDAEARFLIKYVPGFEPASIVDIGRYVGVRDGRHPLGEYVFALADAVAGRSFPDAVSAPMTKTFYWGALERHTFAIPYRCFLPRKISNLLLTGASLSFTYETIFMVMRNFPWCTQTGEIAGCAAALAIEKNIPPKELAWGTPYF